MKTYGKTRIQFNSDVFAALAVVVFLNALDGLLTLYIHQRDCSILVLPNARPNEGGKVPELVGRIVYAKRLCEFKNNRLQNIHLRSQVAQYHNRNFVK